MAPGCCIASRHASIDRSITPSAHVSFESELRQLLARKHHLSPNFTILDVVACCMGGAGGIAALHSAGGTFQLHRISFVPAQHPDTAPLPEGVDIIHLGGSKKVVGNAFLLQEIYPLCSGRTQPPPEVVVVAAVLSEACHRFSSSFSGSQHLRGARTCWQIVGWECLDRSCHRLHGLAVVFGLLQSATSPQRCCIRLL